jgi:hypothetical protein
MSTKPKHETAERQAQNENAPPKPLFLQGLFVVQILASIPPKGVTWEVGVSKVTGRTTSLSPARRARLMAAPPLRQIPYIEPEGQVDMSSVVNLADYGDEQAGGERWPSTEELAAMSYAAAIDWAAGDFDKLIAVAKARDYRPEWIARRIEDHGQQPTAREAAIIARLVAEAGPYISRRQRWIMRLIREKPRAENVVMGEAMKAAEYSDLKRIPQAVGNDLRGLLELGLIEFINGKYQCRGSGERSPSEATPRCHHLGADHAS